MQLVHINHSPQLTSQPSPLSFSLGNFNIVPKTDWNQIPISNALKTFRFAIYINPAGTFKLLPFTAQAYNTNGAITQIVNHINRNKRITYEYAFSIALSHVIITPQVFTDASRLESALSELNIKFS